MAETIEGQMNRLTMGALLRDEGNKLLGKKGIMAGDKKFPDKQPSPQVGQPIGVKTNFYGIRMKESRDVYQYRVEIKLMMPSRNGSDARSYEPTRPAREDARSGENLKAARAAFDLVVARNPDVFGNRERLYYDGGEMLFSLDLIAPDQPDFHIAVERNGQEDILTPFNDRAVSVHLDLKRAEGAIPLADIPSIAKPGTEDSEQYFPLVQFLEIATSEAAVKSGEHVVYQNGEFYLIDPARYGFREKDFPSLENHGMYTAVGGKKSVKLVGNKAGSGHTPALIIDPKIKPFHQIMLVSVRALKLVPDIERHQNGKLEILTKAFTGVCVKPIHIAGSTRPIRIETVRSETARQLRFKFNDVDTSVYDYYQQKHGITLEHPDLPLLEAMGRDKQSIFLPMELYEICDDQPVTNPQMIGDVQQLMLKASTRLPRDMLATIERTANSLHLEDSVYLREANIDVDKTPIEVQGHTLPSPTLIYDPRQPQAYDPFKGNWRSGRNYIAPASLNVWALYALERSARNPFSDDMLIQFGTEFMKQCRMKGMRVNDPADFRVIQPGPINHHSAKIQELEDLFKTAAEAQCQFILLITNKADDKVHAGLKMYEQTYGIITQNVTADTAKAGAGIGGQQKRLTMENIVNKTNMKLGGLNYEISDVELNTPVGEKDLFIGIGMNHPAGGFGLSTKHNDVPSVVGYAANDGARSCEFTGNYVFQEARRDEKLNVIENIVVECLTRFKENRGRTPERIFIYRNGASEGQFPWILEFEVPLLAAAIKDICPAKVVLLVVNKLHNTRLLPSQIPSQAMKAPEQNLPPGTIVDSGITHPYVPEFYLLGHLGRLGTAKVPRYSVLYNPTNVPLAEIYKLTYELAFGHQIITGTTGLPSPAYIADEYAKRGRNIYNAHTSINFGNGNGHNDSGSDRSLNNAQLTEKYSYAGTMLAADSGLSMRTVRFNA